MTVTLKMNFSLKLSVLKEGINKNKIEAEVGQSQIMLELGYFQLFGVYL